LKRYAVLGKDILYVFITGAGFRIQGTENVPALRRSVKRLEHKLTALSKEEIQYPKILNMWREVDLYDDGVLEPATGSTIASPLGAERLIAIWLCGEGV